MRQFAVGDSINVPNQSRGVPRRSASSHAVRAASWTGAQIRTDPRAVDARQRNCGAYCVIIATANDGPARPASAPLERIRRTLAETPAVFDGKTAHVAETPAHGDIGDAGVRLRTSQRL